MKPLKFYADIEDGEIKFLSPEWVREKMSELKDGKYTVQIERFFGKRSSQQNRYFHGVVVPLVLEGLRNAGFDEVKDNEDAKTVIKNLFLKQQITNGCETFTLIKDTHKLNAKEMIDFIEEVKKWSASYLGVFIPEPNTQSKLFAV